MRVFIDLDNASCAGTNRPDYWLDKNHHRLASQMCFNCSEQVDCFLTALVERKCGTWGGAWFPESVANETPTSAMLLRGGRSLTLRRALRRVEKELSRRLGITVETYRTRYGHGELGAYRAVTGTEPARVKVIPS